jgi:hypothetical protein
MRAAVVETCEPMRLGKICSLSILACTQVIRCSMYSGAGILVGRLKFSASCQRYSNLEVSAKTLSNCLLVDILVCSFHLWTRLRRAELCDGAIEKVDLVVEVDD